MRKSVSGFTIVELLVVIVVIAILATISIVSYNGIQQRARAAALSSALSQSTKAVAVYYAEFGKYPPDLQTVGVTNSAATSYQYQVDNNASTPTYCITATTGTTSYKAGSDQTTAQPGGCAGHGVGGVAAITNLVPNPSFEINLSSWSWSNRYGYTGAISTAQAHDGTSSFALTAPATAADAYVDGMNTATVPAGTYTMSLWVYLTSSGATAANRYIWFGCNTGSCTPVQNIAYDQGKLNQWQRVSATVTANVTSNLWIRFYAPTGGTAYFDSAMVTQGATLYSYADGSSPNWVWNGTANNSSSTGPVL